MSKHQIFNQTQSISQKTYQYNNSKKISQNRSNPSLITPKSSKINQFTSAMSNSTQENFFSRVYKHDHTVFFPRQLNNQEITNFDKRDQKIRIPFNKQQVSKIQDLKEWQSDITQWLVIMTESVTSISFNYVLQGKLTEKQGKNFASKNILLNIKELIESFRNLDSRQKLSLMSFINEEQRNIIEQLMHKYPQTAAKGASQRLRKRLMKIDNRNSNEFDFLKKNKIKFQYKQNEDYSSQIMTVLNQLISFPSESFYLKQMEGDEVDSTNYDRFQSALKIIFQGAQSQSSPKEVATFANDMLKPNPISLTLSQQLKKLGLILQIDNQEKVNKSCSPSVRNSSITPSTLLKKNSKNQKQQIFEPKVLDMKYDINHKIPLETKPFSSDDIQMGKFKVQNAPVLRILTKWTEQLSVKLEKSQQLIKNRIQKFKTKDGTQIALDADQRHVLEYVSTKQLGKIQEYLKYMNNQKLKLQMKFAEEINKGVYTSSDTNIGVFAARLQQITAQYMFRYLNKLIHALLAVPIKAAKIYMKGSENQGKVIKNWSQNCAKESKAQAIKSIDLVSFKVGDLMRARVSCSETALIKIYDSLVEISKLQDSRLRIIRIKNRLDHKDNDILVNLFFCDKMQVEIQLSVKSHQQQKARLYSSFNHFLYELHRAQFGPLGELACIIGQLDPLINRFTKYDTFAPKIKQSYTTKSYSQHYFEEQKQNLVNNLPFICAGEKCKKLKHLSNPNFYNRKDEVDRLCNECYANKLENEHELVFVRQIIGKIHHTKSQEYQQLIDHLILWKFQKKQYVKRGFQYLQHRLPRNGMIIEKNKKTPTTKIFQRFTEDNCIYFAHRQSQNSEISIIFYLKNDSELQVNDLEQILSKYFIFGIKNQYQQTDYDISKQRDLQKLRNIERQQTEIKCYWSCNCNFKMQLHLRIATFRRYLNLQTLKKVFKQSKEDIYLHNKKIKDQFEELIRDENQIGKRYNFDLIKNMNLENNELQNIKFIRYFTDLIDLNLYKSEYLQSLDGIQYCKNLKILQITKTKVKSLQPLSQLVNLQIFKLNDNQHLVSLKGLENCKKLECLQVSEAKIHSLDPIRDCVQMKRLIIKAPQIQTFAPLKKMIKMQILQVLFCENLANLEGIDKMKNLKELLIVQATNLAKINYLSGCHNLQKFSCYHSRIDSLDGLISLKLIQVNIQKCFALRKMDLPDQALQNLKILFLNDCKQLQELGNIGLAQNLHIFHGWNNKTIKDSQFQKLSKCKKLTELNLNNNVGEGIGSGLLGLRTLGFLQNCHSLKVFYCNDNIIPSDEYKKIQKCNSIKRLYLRNNLRLHEIAFIDNMNLQCLDISHNENLKDFEIHLFRQKNLIQLSLQNMKIAENAVFWGPWTHLQVLNIRKCNAKLNGLINLKSLEKLYLGKQKQLKYEIEKYLVPEERRENIEIVYEKENNITKDMVDQILENPVSEQTQSIGEHLKTNYKKKRISNRRNSRQKLQMYIKSYKNCD